MADVFISYVRSDKKQVTSLVEALRASGFSVWWDDDIPADAPWETTIERALAAATAVIVCWSAEAVASENVRAEARWARSQDRLLQVFLAPCNPPLFFGERQGVDLSMWKGDVANRDFARVVTRLKQLSSGAAAELVHQPLSPKEDLDPRHMRWRRMLPRTIAALAILLIAVTAVFLIKRPVAAAQTRVAVLPLQVAGSDAFVTSFADSLTEQIVAGLNSSEVPAVSRADSVALRGNDAGSRLEALGVGLVFDGRVQRDGAVLRVQVHVDDPRSHATIWSMSDQGSSSDADTLRARVVHTIVGVVACSHRALQPDGLTEAQLLGRYLRSCDLFANQNDATDPKATFELLDNLRYVIRGAPKFVAARTDLAKFDAYLAPLMPADQAKMMRDESAKEAAAALEIDPKAPDAYLAQEMLLPPTQWQAREALFRKGLAADPAWPHTNGFFAQLLAETGRMGEAIVYVSHAAGADLQIDWRPYAARLTCTAGDTDPAIDDLRSRLAVQPGDDALMSALESCLIDAQRFEEARSLRLQRRPGASGPTKLAGASPTDLFLNAMISRAPVDVAEARRGALGLAESSGASPFAVQNAIEMLTMLGDVDDAFVVAERYRPGPPMGAIVAFMFGTRTVALRRDPRFLPLMQRYGLVGYWRSTGRWPDFCQSKENIQRCT